MTQTATVTASMSITKRNYALDVMKLLFTFLVMFCHTSVFYTKKTTFVNLDMLHAAGWIPVHFFFVVSGMLMVNSFMRKDPDTDNAGKKALTFVINKVTSIGWWYWVSLAIAFIMYCINISMDTGFDLENIFYAVLNDIPEALCITEGGFAPKYMNPTWYISAMLFVMLPLYYLLVKNRELVIYIIAPLGALLTTGYMYHQKQPLISALNFTENIPNSLIRGFCGICFGIIAWIIYDHLSKATVKTLPKILLTISEVAIYILQFASVFCYPTRYNAVYTCLILLPIAVAITFSGKSYFADICRSDALKYVGTWSLALYLNHSVARRITVMYFLTKGYRNNTMIMVVISIVMSIICYLAIKILKYIWNKGLRRFFVSNSLSIRDK